MAAIEFEKVHFSYTDGEDANDLFASATSFALDGVDLTINEGDFVAVLGHNGSGKSTLARLANGLLTPTSGTIHVLGMDATDEKNLFEIRKNVGIVFQNPDNQTVASIVEDDVAFGPENVGIPREEIGERITFALQAVGMEKYRHSTTTRLSGGQKQRIAIAGVLALKPKIMILDEATAMLDPRGRKEVIDVVKKLNRDEKITVLLITHFPEEALLADRAMVISRGKIVAQGTPQEILSQSDCLKDSGLVAPRSIRICRALKAHGVDVADVFSEEALADEIAKATKTCKAENVSLPEKKTENRIQNNEIIGNVLCENLSYTYNPSSPFETHALNGVDLQIKSGSFFGVLGHTGSGKSTFVQHLNALLKLPTAEKKYKPKKLKKGEAVPPKTVLTVNGFDLTDKTTDFKALRKKVGMVFQYPEYQLFAETVFDDVAFGLRNYAPELSEEEVQTAVREALETVGLSFEEVKTRSPFELSGGQKRRVAIAGVIVTKPEILVLDEPASGLDPLGKEDIMRLLHTIHSKWCKTVIIVSHDMDEIAENCTGAAIFSNGKILATDAPKRLFADTALLQSVGLDVPFTAKTAAALKERGCPIDCDFTTDNFIYQTLKYIKAAGAGTQLPLKGESHA